MTTPVAFPVFRAFDHSTGAPLAGGLVNFYIAGTSTRQTVYADPGLTVPLSNPVVLDANGEALIFASSALYKVVLTDSVGAIQWTADNLTLNGTTGATASLSGHNYLMNGDFSTWQAGTIAGGAASLLLPADGWALRIANGPGAVGDFTITKQNASPHPGAFNCVRLQRNAASTAQLNLYLTQNIESLDAVGFCGNYIVLSFWARSGANNTAQLGAPQVYGGTGTDESWQTAGSITGQSTLIAGSALPVLTNAWQQFFAVASAPVPQGVTEATCVINIGGYSASAAGANDYVDITDVQLETGVLATAFDRRTIDECIRRAQRRYYKTFPQATTPVQNAGVTGAYRFNQVVGAAVAAQITAQLPCPSWMRQGSVGPFTLYNPSAANAQIRNVTVAADTTLAAGADDGSAQFVSFTTAAGSAAGNQNAVHYTIDHRF
jgi:hypothetical protein